MDNTVVIVSTGIANTASVRAGLHRVGAETKLSSDPEEITKASRVLLPGVGSFAAGTAHLRDHGLIEVLRNRIHQKSPTMAICLGLQLLARQSEEDNYENEGLGILDVTVKRFPKEVKVPQLGWNEVTPHAESTMLKSGYAYFANSFCIAEQPSGWRASLAHHGHSFVAAIEKGPILAAQFHPELSGSWGLSILEKWLQTTH